MFHKFGLIIFSTFFLFINFSFGQKKNNQRIEILFKKIEKSLHSDYDLTNKLLDSLELELSGSSQKNLVAQSYILRGNLHKVFNDPNKAKEFYDKAQPIIQQNYTKESYILLISNQASNFILLRKKDEALKLANETIKLCNTSSHFDLRSLGLAYFTKGQVYVQNGDTLGIWCLKKSEEFALKTGSLENLGSIHNYLAILYKQIGRMTDAIRECEIAMGHLPKNNVNRNSVLNVWAQALHALGKTKEAEKKYNEALLDSSCTKMHKVFILNSLGILLKDSERYQEADSILKVGLQFAQELNLERKKAEILFNIAGLHFDTKDYSHALEYYEKSKEVYFSEAVGASINTKINLLEMIIRSGLIEHKNYQQIQNYINLRDTLEAENSKATLSKHLTIYEVEKKDNEILNLRNINLEKNIENLKLAETSSNLERINILESFNSLKNLKSGDSLRLVLDQNMAVNKELLTNEKLKLATISFQERILWLGGLALSLISLLLLLIYRQSTKRKRLNKQLSHQKDQIQLLNRELNHRVKNNLAFMTSLLEMQGRRTESAEAKQVLSESETRLKALALVHSQLFRSENDVDINLKTYVNEVLDHLKNIFSIPDKQLKIQSDLIDYQVNAEDAMRLGLIINESVTNSVKHAFLDVKNPNINIKTSVNHIGKLVMEYQDNGPGIETILQKDGVSNSLGLKLISLLKKQLGDRYVVMV